MTKSIAVVAVAVAALVSVMAFAGDDYLGASFDMTTVSDGGSVCAIVVPKRNYAVRCTQDTYVRATWSQDGGPVINKDPIAAQNKLYDLPIPSDQSRICALPVTVTGSCYVYLHREKNE